MSAAASAMSCAVRLSPVPVAAVAKPQRGSGAKKLANVAALPALFTPAESRTIARARKLLERSLSDPAAPALDRPEATRSYLRTRFAGLDHEQVHALFLNAQHVLIAAEVMSLGTLCRAVIYPREVARKALQHNAAAVILAHNHPGGDPTPSKADEVMSASIKTTLAHFDIRLLDHVVGTGHAVVSAAEGGVL